MCCQSQETKGALFTSRETAQPLRRVMRVPSPAALLSSAHRLFAALPELSVGVCAVKPAASLPGRTQP